MAKNLKFNIKNTQLAKVLEQNKLKKDGKQESEAKPIGEEKKEIAPSSTEKKVTRAKKAPTLGMNPVPAATPAAPVVVAEAPVEAVPASKPMAAQMRVPAAPLEKESSATEAPPSMISEKKEPVQESSTSTSAESKVSAAETGAVKAETIDTTSAPKPPTPIEPKKFEPPRFSPVRHTPARYTSAGSNTGSGSDSNASPKEREPYNRDAPPAREGNSSYPPRREGGSSFPPRTSNPYPPREGGSSYPPRTGAPYPPRDGAREGGSSYPPRTGPPYPPREGGSSYPPRTGPPYPPRTGAPYPPRTGPPYPPRTEGGNSYPPRTGPPYPPRTGAPYPPRTGAPYPPRTGAPYVPRSGPGIPPVLPPSKEGKREERPVKKKTFGTSDSPDRSQPSTARRQAFSRVFDSRDRQGLRAGESESDTWKRRRQKQQFSYTPEIPVVRPKSISVKLPISVKELAVQLKLKATDVIQKLFLQGLSIRITDDLNDPTTIELIGHEFDCEIKIDTSQEDKLQITGKSIAGELAEINEDVLQARAPVVTVMGHVDHGKTSIIDAFRKSNLIAGEAGAITQHIGAFRCHTDHGDFTVLDTPGHEAFSAIRARGANVTDIVVLVVAGDEGIMPQTEEAIKQATEAKVPIIVAINKMDKPGFNLDNIYRELAEKNLLPEAWGGTTITVNCSAKTREGIDLLAEMIAIQSDVLELKADPTARARGTILEAELNRGQGITATLLVQNGTLRLGDAIISEHDYGRIKTMQDEHGKRLKEAPPSFAVKITGLSGVPSAGNEFIIVPSEKEARKIAEARMASIKRTSLRQSVSKDISQLLEQKAASKDKKSLNLIIKADVQGSIEAIVNSLKKIPTDKVILNFVTADVGQISESDVERAEATGAIIVGFHTNVESHAESMVKEKKVKVLLHTVIYHLIDEVKAYMTGLLDKLRNEIEVGSAKVQATFKSSQHGVIAGCIVIDGTIKRSNVAKLFRGDEKIWEGSINSLKRHKDDVKEVKKDLECGILLAGYNDMLPEDIIKAYDVQYIAQEL